MAKLVLRALRFALSMAPVVFGSASASALMRAPDSGLDGEWDAARRNDTTTAYTKFIIENPDSAHAEEAAARIAALAAGIALPMIARPDRDSSFDHDYLEKFGDARLMNI